MRLKLRVSDDGEGDHFSQPEHELLAAIIERARQDWEGLMSGRILHQNFALPIKYKRNRYITETHHRMTMLEQIDEMLEWINDTGPFSLPWMCDHLGGGEKLYTDLKKEWFCLYTDTQASDIRQAEDSASKLHRSLHRVRAS